MLLLSVNNVSKAFGPSTVLETVSFHLNAGERVGLVGANGAGKSTLLRILTGEIQADEGEVTIPPGVELGYLPQEQPGMGELTIDSLIRDAVGGLRALERRLRQLEAALASLEGTALDATLREYGEVAERFEQRGGYDLDRRIEAVLAGLGLLHLSRQRRVSTLSGGERVRIMLAALLWRSPDVLLLDEPTNHLDFASAAWLETFLAERRGAVIAVSHDRRFLNGVATKILAIDEHTHRLTEYVGDYDAFWAAKQRERARWQADYERRQAKIKELRQVIQMRDRHVSHHRPPRDNDKFARHFFRERVDQAISRNVRNAEERLKRVESEAAPRPPRPLRINPDIKPADLPSGYALQVDDVRKSFDGYPVLDGISFVLESRARVAIVGPNGAGKSTLLEIVAGRLAPDRGTVRLAARGRLGYLDQDARSLDPRQSLQDAYLDGLDGSRGELVDQLFHHGWFRSDDLGKQIAQLSLGQRRKLQLARLIAERANVLLLDEPTNHLSLGLLEALEEALASFAGAVLAVSHDRWFIERFAEQVWELRGGKLVERHSPPAAVVASLAVRAAQPAEA